MNIKQAIPLLASALALFSPLGFAYAQSQSVPVSCIATPLRNCKCSTDKTSGYCVCQGVYSQKGVKKSFSIHGFNLGTLSGFQKGYYANDPPQCTYLTWGVIGFGLIPSEK
ncbi:hypothetical protein CBNA_1339 [Coxiella burnetii str. Namibia]|nr:hypothetical protein CBNA_1339 [Coxiella burnetii str. Namibia]